MGHGVPFEGHNTVYNPPAGVPEDVCAKAHVFRNGSEIVTCWELTEEELADVIRTKRVWLTMQSGRTLFPHFIGSERTVHMLVADGGPVWKLSESATPPRDVRDGCTICDGDGMFPAVNADQCERDGCPHKRPNLDPDKCYCQTAFERSHCAYCNEQGCKRTRGENLKNKIAVKCDDRQCVEYRNRNGGCDLCGASCF